MEAINQKRNLGTAELDIAGMLCSTGYLPPRNEQDIELFDQIYKGREYKMTTHIIDADAIFQSVNTSDTKKNSGIKKMPFRIDQTQLKAASRIQGKRK